MADWDDDTPWLRSNLAKVFARVRDEALRREPLTIEVARRWQFDLMQGLVPPDPKLVGRFRGEAGLENYNVKIGDLSGVRASDISAELAKFDRKLGLAIAELDRLIKPGQDLTADDLAAILSLSAWAHSEWVRIHPFANGNGRTARLQHCDALRPAAVSAPSPKAGWRLRARRCCSDARRPETHGRSFPPDVHRLAAHLTSLSKQAKPHLG
ncbi:MAG TPA: Fic family protein [Thermoanaerobaculia bacterium]|nr:Fic family protein [Thermoanaerobaculia bacterium]